MKKFIIIVLVSLGMVFVVTTNTGQVSVYLFGFTKNVPLSLLLTFPVGISLLLFSLYHMSQMSRLKFINRELEEDLQSEQEKVLVSVKRTHELEIENQKLKIRLGEGEFDQESI